jgi:hypothetical protein
VIGRQARPFGRRNSNGLAEIAVSQGRTDRGLGLAIGIPVGSSLEGRRFPHNFDLDYAHAKKTELENGLAEATKAPR